MMPPTRLEQLNNFQDAIQSPDGLDRLRALQAVEQALPSSQGLMGMPQVQAPIPMVPRQYGGEVGTGGLVGITDDGVQIFDRSDEGVLNRSIHGGMLKGQTQTTSAPSGFSGGPTAAGTLASVHLLLQVLLYQLVKITMEIILVILQVHKITMI